MNNEEVRSIAEHMRKIDLERIKQEFKIDDEDIEREIHQEKDDNDEVDEDPFESAFFNIL